MTFRTQVFDWSFGPTCFSMGEDVSINILTASLSIGDGQKDSALLSLRNGLPLHVFCPLAPLPDELFITAAELRTNQPWLISITVRKSQFVVLVLVAYDTRWRVGAMEDY